MIGSRGVASVREPRAWVHGSAPRSGNKISAHTTITRTRDMAIHNTMPGQTSQEGADKLADKSDRQESSIEAIATTYA